MNKVKLYPHAQNIRFNRHNFDLLDRFKQVCMLMGADLATDHNFFGSLRYKRLFFLRNEYEKIILNKLTYSDLR